LANIELNIVALGDFTAVNAQIKALQAQVASLNAGLGSGVLSPQLTAGLKTATNDFSNALVASNAFTKQQVQLTSETVKFGQALENGKLSLGQYFQIITGKSGAATTSVKQLALEQTKLQNSVIMADPNKQGFYSVFTPTTINAAANATKIAANEANIYAMAVEKGSQSLINFGKNTQWAGRQLTVGLSMPMILFGSQAVKAFEQTNTALTQLQKVYGEGLIPPSQASIEQISKQVLDLGKNLAQTTGISQEFTVQVASSFAAMGKMGSQLTQATEQTVRLAKLGNLDQQTATSAVIALQNIYKLNTNQLSDAVNYFASIQKQTSLSMNDLVSAESRVGPIIDQLGGSYKDTSVMILAMKEAGVPAAQSANALKSAFASIIAPTKAATTEFAQFGINLNAIKSAGGPVQMIEQLQAGLKNLTPLVREQLIEKLFGKYQFSRISALLENFNKVGSQTANAIKVAGATSSQLQDLANQEMKQATSSPSAQWQIALNTFKADLYPVGQMIMKIGTDVLKFANGVAKAFGGLPGPVKLVLGVLLGFVAISGPIIMLTGLLANFAGNILKGVFNLKQLVTGGKTLGQLLTPELIAAQNASDLFSKGVLGDADAIKLLNEQIIILTNNLGNLVDRMGQGAGLPGLTSNLKTDIGAVLTTESTIARQMTIPGFADGGIINGPGTSTSDNIIARVSPGEAVISADRVQKYHPIVQAIMNNNLPGYATGKSAISGMFKNKDIAHISGKIVMPDGTVYEPGATGSVQYSQLSPEHQAQVSSQFNFTPEMASNDPKLKNSAVSGFSRQFNQATAGGNLSIQNAMEYLGGTPTELQAGKGPVKHDPLTAYSTIMADLGVAAKDRVAVAAQIDQELMTKLQQAAANGKTHIADIVSKESQISTEILGSSVENVASKSGYSTSSIYAPIEARGTYTPPGANNPTRFRRFGKTTSTAGGAALAAKARRGTEFSGTALSFQSEVEQGYNIALSDITAQEKASGTKIGETLASSAKAAIQAASPSKVGEQLAIDFGDGINMGSQKVIPQVEAIGTNVGTTLTESTAKAVTANSGEVVAAADAVAEKASTSMLAKAKGILGGTAGKTGGIGLAMMLPMLTGMLPKIVGGADVSGATSALSTGASAGLMASFIGPLEKIAPEIGITVAALGLFKLSLDDATAKQRQATNTLISSFSVSSQAAQRFGLSFQPLSNYDFSKTTGGMKDHADSIAANKAAVDALTIAYQQAADQQTKDYIGNVGKADPKTLLTMINQKYSTDISNGMTSNQAMQDVTSIMQAAKQSALAISRVQENLTKPSNTKEAFSNVVKNSLIDTSTGKEKPAIKQTLNAFQARRDPLAVQQALNNISPTTVTALQTAVMQLISGPAKNLGDAFNSLKGTTESTLLDNKSVFNALSKQITSTVPELSKYTEKLNKGAGSTQALAEAAQIYQVAIKGNLTSFDALTAAMSKGPKALDDFFKGLDWSKLVGQKVDKNGKVINTGSTDTTPFTGTPAEKALEKVLQGNLKAQNAQLKIARDELTVQNKISQEAKQQLQYQQQITGLQNDMKTAMITGNYLQAAGLKQQISGAAVDFNATSVQTKMQNQVDSLQSNADQINQALSDLKDAIANGTTTIDKTIFAAKSLPIMRAQQIVGGVSGGAAVNTIININGPVDQKAINAVSAAVTTAVKSTTKVKTMASKVVHSKNTKK